MNEMQPLVFEKVRFVIQEKSITDNFHILVLLLHKKLDTKTFFGAISLIDDLHIEVC